MNKIFNQTIGEIVKEDYRAAQIFSKYKIDFCCKGNRTIDEACENKSVDKKQLLKDLETNKLSASYQTDYKSLPTDLLIDIIVKKHHRYVNQQIPVLMQYVTKIARVHGANHPELIAIKELFQECSANLLDHMEKEEKMLFPYIMRLLNGLNGEHSNSISVKTPIGVMMHEHESEGNRFARINELSNAYQPPTDACTTYKVAFSLLKDFEEDLHLHIHLENNILFPAALELENAQLHLN